MASSAFSFHCMICFEEFDTQTNYPVVLPCGHTYVCIECANRLDKCMECRTPLTMKIDLPPPAPSAAGGGATPLTPGSRGAGGGGGAASPDPQQQYADRVRNSPGFRRRYGNREEYRDSYGPKRQPHQTPPQPPQPIPKQRLPLPKNAVLLSLMQASEPARRRAEVEAPPTPQKSEEDGNLVTSLGSPPPAQSTTPPAPLPKYSRPSPLFLDGSSSGEHDCAGAGHGSMRLDLVTGNSSGGAAIDDEEHKIRVGTYLEGGPCGTYAVAAREGLLVYPTLFEHALPAGLKGLRRNGSGDGAAIVEEEDVVKRDVEEMVKKHRAKTINQGSVYSVTTQTKIIGNAVAVVDEGGGGERLSPGGERVSPVNTEIGATHTWVECSHEDENVEARCTMPTPRASPGRDGNGGGNFHFQSPEVEAGHKTPQDADASMSDPGGAAIDISNEEEEEDHAGLSVSLTISDDESDAAGEEVDLIGTSSRTVPARRSQSVVDTLQQSGSAEEAFPASKKLVRHLSHGSRLIPKKRTPKKKGKSESVEEEELDEFDRPLVRLKYGDRVQVVSMDSRGWVKLARGYGYIRLENDKQLVKVGGTSDKACQIEAMLHELSIERNRLKQEQTKLEHLSAGLMIDLQSTLLASDDHVIVPAPEGSLLRNESELSLSAREESRDLATSLDDIDVSARSRTVLTPPRNNENSNGNTQHRQIRTAKSHSPGRSSAIAGAVKTPKTPPSPPYGQVTPNNPPNSWSNVNTPTRVNFRTGLSGHRALTSSHSHPHDFIDRGSGTIRSMSNHMGVSSSKKPSSRGRSIY